MVSGLAVDTSLILAFLVFVELLEAIFGIGVVLDVVALVLLDVTLVLEGEGAAWAPEERTHNGKQTGSELRQRLGAAESNGLRSHCNTLDK